MWRKDPVTLDELEEPYLASDGITYSRDTLVHVILSDEWHRSPITREVLRPLAYPNLFAAEALGAPMQATEPLQLYDPDTYVMPVDGSTFTSTLPQLPSAAVMDVLLEWDLDECEDPLSLTVRVCRDGPSGVLWLMHPPPPTEMRADAERLAGAFGIHRLAANPWCVTSAVLSTGVTVEEQWCRARSGTAEA